MTSSGPIDWGTKIARRLPGADRFLPFYPFDLLSLRGVVTNCVKALSDPIEWPGVCTDTSQASAMARASITVDATPLSGRDILEIWPPSRTGT